MPSPPPVSGNADPLAHITALVQGFRQNLPALKDAGTLEAVVRQEYIDPFWTALGWDVANTAHLPPDQKEVIIEAPGGTVEGNRLRCRRPDYLFRVGGFPRLLVEAKKPAVNLAGDRDAIFQAKTYAWSMQLPFAILTDFEEFKLFDTTLKPFHDEPARGLVPDFDLRFEDYLPQWDVLRETFGRDAVAGGSLEKLLARIKNVRAGRRIRGIDRMLIDLRGSEPVDRAFLAHLEAYRLRFARAIYEENRAEFPDGDTRHGAAHLTEATQRLIDRIVFMRVCEDRDVTAFGELRELVNNAAGRRLDVYTELTARFRSLDHQYNGYLFKPHFSEQLKVPAQLLADFIGSTYPPAGPWRFDAIGDDLLGIIYERFLGSTITVKSGEVDAQEKPEVRHAGGVYYTPRFVVECINRRVVDAKLAGKTPLEVLGVKILDPACGSGSFLIAAFGHLIDYCQRHIAAHPGSETVTIPSDKPRGKPATRRLAFNDPITGQCQLMPEFKGELLTHCLHGVDIDAQAVEVTIMSLYLKMLETRLPENWQRDLLVQRLLPPLDNNIRCGNSLLSQTDFDRWWEDEHGSLFAGDADVRFRMNPFDWTSSTRGFGRLLDGAAGFDCIIGNPPYIRVQELNKWAPDECEFYKWRYKSAAKGNYDIYVVFIERALELLASDGLLGFICPHKFWQAAYGEGLRRLIAERRSLHSIVDFTHQQVFTQASTYTAVQVFSERPNGQLDYAAIEKLDDGDAQCRLIDSRGPAVGTRRFTVRHPSGGEQWGFESGADSRHRRRLLAAPTVTLGAIADRMFQGVRTSMNEVFVLGVEDRKRNRYRSPLLGLSVTLEPGILRPFLGGDDIRRYEIAEPSQVVVFPYSVRRAGPTVELLPSAQLSAKFPLAWEYLKRCERSLRGRESDRMNNNSWYAYGRTQNLDLFGVPRIIVRDIVDSASFTLDPKGKYAFVSGYGLTLKPPHANLLPYVLGLLNSRLLNDFLKSVSTTLRGGWFRPFPQFMKQIPIKLPETPAEKKQAEQIAQRVGRIIESRKKLQDRGLGDHEREHLEREVEADESRIDEVVCGLYGVETPKTSPIKPQ
ncbi:MAG TPA: Eco57I restriction-modification methylase domain-containing protein [Tepidisphaeraceae bacterium]|nr:Eco57I restriction-modification methylase domain-containing protein [Tepidisphaeraceae bacterium]